MLFPLFTESLMGLSQRTMADYINHTNPQAARTLQADRTRFVMFSRDQTRGQSSRRTSGSERESVCVCVCVYYQSLHGLDVRRVDGQGLLIPALGLVHVAPQLGYLPPHVQHVMGRGEEVGGFLRAGRGLGGLRHAGVHLSYQRDVDREERQTNVFNCECSYISILITVNKWDDGQHNRQPLSHKIRTAF